MSPWWRQNSFECFKIKAGNPKLETNTSANPQILTQMCLFLNSNLVLKMNSYLCLPLLLSMPMLFVSVSLWCLASISIPLTDSLSLSLSLSLSVFRLSLWVYCTISNIILHFFLLVFILNLVVFISSLFQPVRRSFLSLSFLVFFRLLEIFSRLYVR